MDVDDLLSYAAQLPIVALVVWLVFKFISVMKEERKEFSSTLSDDRKDFLAHLDTERKFRGEYHEKLDITLTGLTTGMTGMTHELKELRSDVKARNTNPA